MGWRYYPCRFCGRDIYIPPGLVVDDWHRMSCRVCGREWDEHLERQRKEDKKQEPVR